MRCNAQFFKSRVFVLLMIVLIIASLTCMYLILERDNDTDTPEWDFLIFTQLWPGSECLHEAKCKVPQGIDGWTIHGLWPTKSKTLGPNFCNNSWHFSIDKVQSIESDLEEKWPNYHTNERFDSLWQHEWIKHGTCAKSLPSLNGELNYFKKGIELHKQLDIFSVLEDHDIIPSNDKFYTLDDISNVISSHYGHKVTITCEFMKHGISALSQIEICVDKQFQVVDCEDKNDCGSKITYPMINSTLTVYDKYENRQNESSLMKVINLIYFAIKLTL